MSIAFIIQAHKNPAQLERLLHRLAHPDIDCYIHIDAKCDLADWQQVMTLPQVYLVKKRVNVTWAGWGLIQATLNSMASVIASGRQYAYITQLSGQDYPLKSAVAIHNYLYSQHNIQFMDIINEDELRRTISKVEQYHFVDYNFPGKYRLAEYLNKILPKRKAPLGHTFYSGSVWWTLTQDCVKYCIEYEQQHPELRRFYKLSWGADEFIFQTILMNSEYQHQIAGHNLHYIDWSEGKANPKLLGMEDMDAMMLSDKLFARKFDQDHSPGLLDKIDTLIISD
ncbi:beta-1,6-N-acetylglucosaminyltransferase [Chitinophaga sp. MM2321]|uniref:beta-1,6-N-acetylglucosaminyltransferase n=1 Tax=Chitinophaga sp. MM2321 TaxID=3137178 RepID=UPI0032D58279